MLNIYLFSVLFSIGFARWKSVVLPHCLYRGILIKIYLLILLKKYYFACRDRSWENQVSFFEFVLEKSWQFLLWEQFSLFNIFLQRILLVTDLCCLTSLLRLTVKRNRVFFCVQFLPDSYCKNACYSCFGASKCFRFCVISVWKYRDNGTLFTVILAKYLIK